MFISHKKHSISEYAFLLIAIITSFSVLNKDGVNYNLSVLFLYLMISLIALFFIFLNKKKSSITVNKTFHMFYFFFFGLAPAFQFKNGITFFNAQQLNLEIYLELGVLLIICQLIYIGLYDKFYIFFKKKIKQKNSLKDNTFFYPYLILSLLALLCFIILVKFNFKILFKTPKVGWQKLNTQFGLIGYSILLVVRFIPAISLLHYLINKKQIIKKELAMLLFLLVITVFPFSVPRATLIIVYLPILVLLFPILNNNNYYSLSFFVSFLVVFPLLDFFRNDVTLGLKLFLSPHLDAFHNFAQLYANEIITNGNQLLGSILFFLPKEYWLNNNKIVGTGQMLAEKCNFDYTNISMPFFGEGYANFGVIGVLFFLIIIVFFNAYIDTVVQNKKNYIFLRIVFCFFLGFEFYLLRGDLYSSFKKSVSFFLALIFSMLFLKLFRKTNKIY